MLLDLISLVKKYDMKINGVIQIGAHYGQEDSTYKILGIKNKMFFEPLKRNFEILKQNVSEDSILINKALGNETKNIKMFVETANRSQSSSILKPKLHLTQYPRIQFNEEEEVEMTRLDEIQVDTSKYNFIIIDVQGYELEVFKGSEKTLENIDYIMSEINRDELYENCAKIDELIEFLSPYGFKLVEQNWVGVTWGDGLFIKQ